MNPEMKIIREVSIQAENFYNDAVKLGDHAAIALRREHRSQMTGLENIAESTLKISDVFDYIKRQTARFPDWRSPAPGQESLGGFGERLKNYLEKELKKKLESICSAKGLNIGDTTDEEKQERRRVHLLLIRQFIRQMVVEYEYQVSLGQGSRNSRRREAE
ncbi:MAG: hypothetical protein IMW89_02880 [Ktedonobacteraceae bacterium]|nr:hypothetical protein [Ktedonobacteraceae bacterium]